MSETLLAFRLLGGCGQTAARLAARFAAGAALVCRVALLPSLTIAQTLAAGGNGRPNVLVIYTDDQAAWTLGISGNSQAHTPNLDRLAGEGVRLTNAFVTTPVCSPSRGGWMTSRYSSEIGIHDFIPPREHREFDPQADTGLRREFVTLPEVLQGAGYDTALFGKWHLGDWRDDPERKYHPTRHGFGHFLGFVSGSGPANPVTVGPDGTTRQWQGLTDDLLTGEAIDFIRQPRARPFFVQLNLRSPHAPWKPVAAEDERPYADLDPAIPNPDYPDLDVADVKRRMKEYLASVTGVDRNVGRVLEALRIGPLAERTVVIFTSDNGYNVGHNGIWHKGNGIWATRTVPPDTPGRKGRYRPNLYDHSLRVPAIVRWPRHIPPGQVVAEPVSNLDWFPTIAAMASAEIPPDAVIRGRNALPLLLGASNRTGNHDFYAEYDMRIYAPAKLRAYRTPSWKLIRDFLNTGRDELYWLARDPEEKINLIGDARPEVITARKALEAQLLARMRELNDPLLASPAVK